MEPGFPTKVSQDPDSARRDRPAKPEVQRPDDTDTPGPDLGRAREPGEPPEPADEADGTPGLGVPRNPDERAPDKAPAGDRDKRSDLADVGEADGQRGQDGRGQSDR
jgi:hypothetical protein